MKAGEGGVARDEESGGDRDSERGKQGEKGGGSSQEPSREVEVVA